MFEELTIYKAELERIESKILNKFKYSYTLGVNLVGGEVTQVKLYVRLFSKQEDMGSFCNIVPDESIRSVVKTRFQTWSGKAFERTGLGFKGFTILLGYDLNKDNGFFGFGGKRSEGSDEVFEGIVTREANTKVEVDKRIYKYEKKGSVDFFGRKLKFCTDIVEVQYNLKDLTKPRKVCLCPEYNKDNILKLTKKIESNVSTKNKKFNQDVKASRRGLQLVNIGFGPEKEEKLYYHNFSKQNKIGGYI